MDVLLRLCFAVLLASASAVGAPALAGRGAAGIDIVNATNTTITGLYIRRTGTAIWAPLPATPARPLKGAHAASAFSDPDCAFDIKATLDPNTVAVWTGVNLCEVKSVTLNRNAAGVTWADYD